MTARPGCVGCTPDQACPIHRTAQGIPCVRCAGIGRLRRYDKETNTHIADVCEVCAGVGLIDRRTRGPRASKPEPVDERPLIREMSS